MQPFLDPRSPRHSQFDCLHPFLQSQVPAGTGGLLKRGLKECSSGFAAETWKARPPDAIAAICYDGAYIVATMDYHKYVKQGNSECKVKSFLNVTYRK